MNEASFQKKAREVENLLQDAYERRINDLESSIAIAKNALAISKNLASEELIAKSLSKLAFFQMILGNYPVAIEVANEAIEKFKRHGGELGVAEAKYTIAGALYKTDNFNLGLKHLLDCLLIYKRYDDLHNQARVYKAIGTIHEYFGDQPAAIKAYESAVDCAESVGDLNLQSNAFNPLSGILLNQGKVDEAMQMIEKSIAMKDSTQDVRGMAFALYGRAKVYTTLGQFELAETDFMESIRIHQEMGEKLGVAMAFHKLGAMFLAKEDFDNACLYLEKALEFANEHNIALIKFKGNYLMYELNKAMGEDAKALTYLERYVKEKELVINSHTTKLIEGYDALAEMESAAAEIKVEKERSSVVERKNLELDSFFYRVSHDLKGPITSLFGLDMVAREELEDEKSLQYLDMYKQQVLRINHILDSLIKFTRTNHFAEVAEDIDFRKLTQDCVAAFSYLPNFELIHFSIDVDPEISFKAEWTLVNTIIQNLIENAIKYMRKEAEKPKVEISISKANEWVSIIVEDNGKGMDENTRQNIFDMFYQGQNIMQGTGLGLFILKKSVEKLHGRVKLTSVLNEGTTFTIEIPTRNF